MPTPKIESPEVLLPELFRVLEERSFKLRMKHNTRVFHGEFSIECLEDDAPLFGIIVEDRMNGRNLIAVDGAVLEKNKAPNLSRLKRVFIAEFVHAFSNKFIPDPFLRKGAKDQVRYWAKGPLKNYLKTRNPINETLDKLISEFIKLLGEIDKKLRTKEVQNQIQFLQDRMEECTEFLSDEEVMAMWQEAKAGAVIGE